MSDPKKPIWKRCRLQVAVLLVLLASVVATAYAHLYFCYEDYGLLAKLRSSQVGDVGDDDPRPLIIAHRGAKVGESKDGRVIGNTARAIRRGVESGSDWIEIDVMMTKDGQLVVFHDPDVRDKTNGEGRVGEMLLADLQELDVVGLERGAEKILTLDEVFKQLDSERQHWIIDIKVKGISAELFQWLGEREELKEQGRVILFGRHDILEDYTGSGFPLGYTETWSGLGNRVRVFLDPAIVIRRGKRLGCKYLVLPILLSHQSLVDAAVENGFEVWIAGSDEVRDLEHAVVRGIGGVIVDEPERVMGHFGGRSLDNAVRRVIEDANPPS